MAFMSLAPLPIDALIAEIVLKVRESQNLILTATPGAGKTTRLPPELLKAVSGKIIVLEPRRMAAVAACERVAEERHWTTGQEVGYQVRFESRVSSATRLVFMTDALLLRQMIDDPELTGVDLIVLDEFHERNLNQDLVLGCLRELQELGRPIKILIMSATLDVRALIKYLPGCKHIDVPGVIFPLEIRHSNQPLRLQTDYPFYDRVVQAIETASLETQGDILVFLPGTGEIWRCEERLRERGLKRQVVPLHGSLPLAEQREVLAPPRTRRVILSTNVAEASVTVQGVDFVIDTGLAKVMEMNPHSGFSSLELTRISQFNARQRAGRAARQKSGVCWRLWTNHEEATQLVEMPAESQRADLAGALLLLSHFGVSDFASFAWFERPPSSMLDIAIRSLIKIGALTKDRRLSDLGAKLIRYPLPPRWGALLAMAEVNGEGALGAKISSILNERDFADRGATTEFECDVLYRLMLLDDLNSGQRPGGVNFRQLQTVADGARQLERQLVSQPFSSKIDPLAVRKLILLSQKDRLCRRRGASDRGLMVGGRGVRLNPESQVRGSEFFVALQGVDLPGKTETLLSIACGLSKAFVLENLKDEIEVVDEIEFVEEKGQFYAKRIRVFAGLPLEEATLTQVDPALVAEKMPEILLKKWNWLVTQNEKLGRWMERWKFWLIHAPDLTAPLSEEQILKTLTMASFGKTKISDVLAQDIVTFLEMNIEKSVLRDFHNELPEKFAAPSGHSHRIHYAEGHSAYVEVRLQEIFGLMASPRLVFGKIPLTFRLLGPNYRPVQVTSDLANFWRSGYLEVRKELRSRYPKHSWPDDPLTARPEAKGRRRENQ